MGNRRVTTNALLQLVGAAALLILCWSASTYSQTPQIAKEEDIRAVVVHNLLRFSRWEGTSDNQVNICSEGNGAVTQALKNLSSARAGGSGIKYTVQENDTRDKNRCDVLVIGPEREVAIKESIGPDFVICNGCEINRESAAVEVILINKKKIGYNLNINIAAKSGIQFRSEIIRLANKVEGRYE